MKLTQFGAASVLASLALLPLPASAYCACACVNGLAQNVCTNSFDVEVYCVKFCPTSALPPGAPQRNPDLESFASEAGKTNPQDKLSIGGR
ncbi:hypothetical protein [Methylobacterium sp. Leaf125]|uniref:hypothetical protein n=1 Tax=Methylobacterium sp. Leaf125 TaxID=1736265 RepID=UPI000A9347AC|nr:hypothetical protein [Methylobacterium sp. Leaf125]